MKNSDFYRAVAFIMEGDTEWEFYLRFVAFICEKNGFLLEHAPDEYSGEPIHFDGNVFIQNKDKNFAQIFYWKTSEEACSWLTMPK